MRRTVPSAALAACLAPPFGGVSDCSTPSTPRLPVGIPRICQLQGLLTVPQWLPSRRPLLAERAPLRGRRARTSLGGRLSKYPCKQLWHPLQNLQHWACTCVHAVSLPFHECAITGADSLGGEHFSLRRRPARTPCLCDIAHAGRTTVAACTHCQARRYHHDDMQG